MLKFNKDSVFGTFTVIIGLCLICSVLVSSAVVALGPFQQAAINNDRQVNILKVSGYDIEGTVADTFKAHIEARLVDLDSGKFVPDVTSEQAEAFNFQSLSKDPNYNTAIPADVDYAKMRFRTKNMPVYLAKNDKGSSATYYHSMVRLCGRPFMVMSLLLLMAIPSRVLPSTATVRPQA